MDSSGLKPWQAKRIVAALRPALGYLSRLRRRMEERGLISRERDKEDRRVWRIWLTTKGKELGKTLPAQVTKNREKLYAGISQADFDTFNQVLEKLIENATKLSKA